jgi:hypothetical protein
MALAKPGPEHAELKKMEGVWNCEVKSLHEPDAEPRVEKGKAKFKMTLGGLFLRQDYEGSMMGTPFTGVGYTAFNKATGKFEALWIDSMGSGMMCLTGVEKDKVCTYHGHFFGPGGVKIPARYVLTKVNDDKQTLVMFMNMGQGEMKSMEMTYTRAKE